MTEGYKVGDKVRLLHGKEVGVIMQLYSDGRILLLVDDFIEMEVHAGDIVHRDIPKEPKRTVAASEFTLLNYRELPHGLYLSLDIDRPEEYVYHLTNHTRYIVSFVMFSERAENKFVGRLTGEIFPGTAQLLLKVKALDWENDARLFFQFLFSQPELPAPIAPVNRRLKLKGQTFSKERSHNPYLKKNVILVSLATADQLEPIAMEAARPTPALPPIEAPKPAEKAPPKVPVDRPEPVIDLHINCLVENPKELNANESLKIQLDTFERALENAMAHAMHAITFIHGVGNGTLKSHIHQRLKGLKAKKKIKEFALDRSEIYGAGATKVNLE